MPAYPSSSFTFSSEVIGGLFEEGEEVVLDHAMQDGPFGAARRRPR